MKALVSAAEQGTDQWFIDRIPCITASSMHAVMAKGQGKSRNSYMVKKMCELMTGRPQKSFKSVYMQNGNDNEHYARQIYEMLENCTVEEMGFAWLKDELIGASTDGLIGDKGLVEIKNVIVTEQVAFITSKKPKGQYLKQMQTQMYVLERDWCDFVSLSLGDEENGVLPEEYQYEKVRVFRDEAMIISIRKESAMFHHDMQKLIKKLKEAKNV